MQHVEERIKTSAGLKKVRASKLKQQCNLYVFVNQIFSLVVTALFARANCFSSLC